MGEVLQISGKDLGEIALGSFCPRCFWIKRHVKKLPFQIFPGIFSSFDSYTKKVIHAHIDRHGTLPAWLREVGEVTGYKEPPHWSKFRRAVDEHGIVLTGAPDAVFVASDGTFVIADYKTARYTKGQDELLPMYEVQLNAYAFIGQKCDLAPVSRLALIYMEPTTDDGAAADPANVRSDGFAIGFTAHVHPVKIDLGRVDAALARARAIYDGGAPPTGRDGCKDCTALANLLENVR